MAAARRKCLILKDLGGLVYDIMILHYKYILNLFSLFIILFELFLFVLYSIVYFYILLFIIYRVGK
jgi:hypothetical protein